MNVKSAEETRKFWGLVYIPRVPFINYLRMMSKVIYLIPWAHTENRVNHN